MECVKHLWVASGPAQGGDVNFRLGVPHLNRPVLSAISCFLFFSLAQQECQLLL